jgi:hypothetical protein
MSSEHQFYGDKYRSSKIKSSMPSPHNLNTASEIKLYLKRDGVFLLYVFASVAFINDKNKDL